jgi:N-acetylglucosaminyldiphosphoundecaprenol N-acetyl-beta-D-mannosaminyltransferase
MDRKIRYFFFGSKPGVTEEAAENILEKFPGVEIAGCRNGFFSEEDEPEIIRHINSANADMLLVALGSPKQEIWIHKHKDLLNCKVCIGVGGSLDVFAGRIKAAPEFFRRNGLEWLYRLYTEPKRFKRMLKLPQYVFLAISYRYKK